MLWALAREKPLYWQVDFIVIDLNYTRGAGIGILFSEYICILFPS